MNIRSVYKHWHLMYNWYELRSSRVEGYPLNIKLTVRIARKKLINGAEGFVPDRQIHLCSNSQTNAKGGLGCQSP